MTTSSSISEPGATVARTRSPGLTRNLDWRYLLYLQLHAWVFVATTLLLVWGATFLFFLALGGFSVDGMMAQLANLSTRYVAANTVRQAEFRQLGGELQLGLAVIFIVARRRALLPPLHEPPVS